MLAAPPARRTTSPPHHGRPEPQGAEATAATRGTERSLSEPGRSQVSFDALLDQICDCCNQYGDRTLYHGYDGEMYCLTCFVVVVITP
jgi:hypothetical protein